jgi:hypothetical protein
MIRDDIHDAKRFLSERHGHKTLDGFKMGPIISEAIEPSQHFNERTAHDED